MATSSGTWLEAQRHAAWEMYGAAPRPDRVAHLWRYTDPALILPVPTAVDREWKPGLMRIGEVPAGVEVTGLREAIAAGGPARDRFGSLLPASFGPLEALNAAAWQDGVFVRVPRGLVVKDPLVISSVLGDRPFNASRLLVILEDGAALTVVRDYTGGNAAGAQQVNGVIEILAGADAAPRLVVVQELNRGARLALNQRTLAGRNSRCETVLCSFGGGVVKADIGTILDGEGAESESWGVIVGDARQHFDHHTVHEHRAGRTRSNFDYKTVLRDRARSAYTGLIRIDAGAKGCAAYQENRNLMLDETAKADSIPELEILNDEVQCTHGATMGPIEPEYIFYLQSRGIPKADSIRMYVEGFVEPALTRLPPALHDRLRAHLEARLAVL